MKPGNEEKPERPTLPPRRPRSNEDICRICRQPVSMCRIGWFHDFPKPYSHE